MVVAFREFAVITDESIANERKRFRAEVVVSIEDFAKRSTLRNLKQVGRLDKRNLGLAYDHFQLATLKSRGRTRSASSARSAISPAPSRDGEKVEIRIDRRAFGSFISGVSTWARDEKTVKNGFHEHIERTPVDHELIDRIFVAWDITRQGALSFQVGLSFLSVLYRC